MDHSRLLFLIFVVIRTSEETAEPQCVDLGKESYNLSEGEALYFLHYDLENNLSDEEITWFKENSSIEITTDENENVHYHGGALFFLNLLTEHSGLYTARHKDPSGECYNYFFKVVVFKDGPMTNKKLLYADIKNSDISKRVTCPRPVDHTCSELKGNFTWNKDNKPLPGYHEVDFRIDNAKPKDKGIYTCICTWTHNNKEYMSSGSRRLQVDDYPISIREIQILSPTNKEQFADEGVGIKLNCTVFCGTNVDRHCDAGWLANENPVDQIDGYNQTFIQDPSNTTIITAVLTIEQVSAQDLKTQFKCFGTNSYTTESAILTLQQRESIIPLVTGGLCVLLICVFAAVLIKCFAIDLALLFRPYLPISNYKKDAVYDAYVVYQMQNVDKFTEDSLCQFITNVLPSVLEEKCGYRLFIHGRDDIPGEDLLELVEDRMQQSRRLMVILTPGSGSGSESTDQHPVSPRNSMIGGFDWQVGLHHALFQREMSVILIQLGDTGPQGYTHLPAGLQHLILKSAPIQWPEGSRGAAAWNSRFWKRVRYLMPARPAKIYPLSAII
ncbi:interleukin-1 receptor type 1-like isoform X2 [Cottoperca gobio]|nr:interleukin-1 receptor type 1-like isoform X2 [Cottoperca gobio]